MEYVYIYIFIQDLCVDIDSVIRRLCILREKDFVLITMIIWKVL